jgi:hypothetical protein
VGLLAPACGELERTYVSLALLESYTRYVGNGLNA